MALQQTMLATMMGGMKGAWRGPSLSLPHLQHSIAHTLRPLRPLSGTPFIACSSNENLHQTTEAPSDSIKKINVDKVSPDALDIRVGMILKAWKHPEADSLYVEEVDMGEVQGPRTICSGLASYIPLDELQGRSVVVLANLKPRNMRGIKSDGMLLAASDATHQTVQLLMPPEGSLPGERIWFGSETGEESQGPPATPNQLHKKKVWEAIQPQLSTNSECIAVFGDMPMRTKSGLVSCRSLINAKIS